jgi:inner membrane protein YidH
MRLARVRGTGGSSGDEGGWGHREREVDAPGPSDRPANAPEDGMAMTTYQTGMALERTMLAWVRTALSMVSLGFGIVAFFRSLRLAQPGEETRRLHLSAIGFGLSLIVLGLIAMALAGTAHQRDLQRLIRGELPRLRRWPHSLTLTLLLGLLGLVGLGALLTLLV